MIVDILTFLVKMTFRTCDKTDVPRSKKMNPKIKKGCRLNLQTNLRLNFSLLRCDYYDRGHLDNVDQSDNRKIRIHSKKVSSQPIISSSRKNAILIANVFHESKCFTRRFAYTQNFAYTPMRHISLTQAVILSCTLYQLFLSLLLPRFAITCHRKSKI